jgi:hypothetical protein
MPDRFVWLLEHGRYVAQKWPADGLGAAHGRTIAADLFISPGEAAWPIARLASKYPPPSAVGEVLPPTPLGFWS